MSSYYDYIARTVDGLVNNANEEDVLTGYRAHQDKLRSSGVSEHEILGHDIMLLEGIKIHIQNYSGGSA